MTIDGRITELEALAKKRKVDAGIGDLFDPDLTVIAYAEALNLDAALVFDLELTLKEIEALSV